MSLCLCSDDVCQCSIEALRDKVMQALLHASLKDASDERLRFVPRESLIEEITPEFTSRVLQRIDNTANITADVVQEAANRISPRGACSCGDPMCTGRRVIFTSLMSAGLHDILAHFLHADDPGSCDSVLWKLSQPENSDEVPIFRQIRQLEEIQKDLFYHWAYQLQALCFRRGRDNEPVNKLKLEDGLEDRMRLPWTLVEKAPKPFIRESAPASTNVQVVDMQSAKVEKVYIHRSHHNLDSATNRFALKTFLDDFGKDIARINFENELKTNRSVSRNHRTLSLYAAFEHRGSLHLLFPWAELGDLLGIWKQHSHRHDGAAGQHVSHAEWYSSQWLLEECLGISSAVAHIHGLSKSTPMPQWLLHADIKPENILGFPNQGSVFLKLADFGHSKVLETASPRFPVKDLDNTQTYRAPETDTQKSVTTKFDVWSLGCLFLDFATWALMGWDKVEEFREKRLCEEKDLIVNHENVFEDTFFKRVAGPRNFLSWSTFPLSFKRTTNGKDSKISFTRKHNLTLQGFNRPVVTQVRGPVTTQIEDLRNHPGCDKGIRELLDLIEARMLVPDCSERAWSNEVQNSLSEILLRRSKPQGNQND